MAFFRSPAGWATLLFIGIGLSAAIFFGRTPTRILRFTEPSTGSFIFEVLNDRMFRFEVFPGRHRPELRSLATTAMLPPRQFAGPTLLKRFANGFETAKIQVTLTQTPFCFKVQLKETDQVLSEFCPQIPGAQNLILNAPTMTHAYGLGEQLQLADEGPELNWVGRRREPGGEFGNKMVSFAGGAVGNAQFPILYALGGVGENFALFLDNTFKQTWDLSRNPWRIELNGGAIRGYWFTGRDLSELRTEYMDLVGRPPVLPRKAFGLWVSEYGFDNWQEIESKLKSLRAAHFPIDGFVLDLQWFGGIQGASEASPMGGLQWDEANFPEAPQHIADLHARGIGLMTMEEPYVAKGVKDRSSGQSVFETLEQHRFLAMDASGKQGLVIDPKAWWGSGGMIDWSLPEAGKLWHDWKRQPLIQAGIMGHWTDLGEPEAYRPEARYHLGEWSQAEVHNLYNLWWSESIFEGYRRNGLRQRPWIHSRSGTAGSQRYAVSMWSGDIGSNFESLAAHTLAQGHMSLSGVDYFGSDIGGFTRGALRGDLNRLYTAWFANSAMFDIPVRPHVENLCNCKETAPDRIGDRKSNLVNLRLRYELIPYYYSLAHQAHLAGEPIVAPLVYYFNDDMNARARSFEKMIGSFLLTSAVVAEKPTTQDVYLPKGEWFDFYSGAKLLSAGQVFTDLPLQRDGVLRLPLFARAGAVLPQDLVDENGQVGKDLVVTVFPAARATEFTLLEDDGESVDYLSGKLRKTRLTQAPIPSGVAIEITSAQGSFLGGMPSRQNILRVVSSSVATGVSLNGKELPKRNSADDLKKNQSGWWQNGNWLMIQSGNRPVSEAKKFNILFSR